MGMKAMNLALLISIIGALAETGQSQYPWEKGHCLTQSGKTCKHPFVYEQSTYYGCTKEGANKTWCYIEGKKDEWEYCAAKCMGDSLKITKHPSRDTNATGFLSCTSEGERTPSILWFAKNSASDYEVIIKFGDLKQSEVSITHLTALYDTFWCVAINGQAAVKSQELVIANSTAISFIPSSDPYILLLVPCVAVSIVVISCLCILMSRQRRSNRMAPSTVNNERILQTRSDEKKSVSKASSFPGRTPNPRATIKCKQENESNYYNNHAAFKKIENFQDPMSENSQNISFTILNSIDQGVCWRFKDPLSERKGVDLNNTKCSSKDTNQPSPSSKDKEDHTYYNVQNTWYQRIQAIPEYLTKGLDEQSKENLYAYVYDHMINSQCRCEEKTPTSNVNKPRQESTGEDVGCVSLYPGSSFV